MKLLLATYDRMRFPSDIVLMLDVEVHLPILRRVLSAIGLFRDVMSGCAHVRTLELTPAPRFYQYTFPFQVKHKLCKISDSDVADLVDGPLQRPATFYVNEQSEFWWEDSYNYYDRIYTRKMSLDMLSDFISGSLEIL